MEVLENWGLYILFSFFSCARKGKDSEKLETSLALLLVQITKNLYGF